MGELDVFSVFDQCQRSSAVHKKSVILLSKENDCADVQDKFFSAMKKLLPVFRREASVERLVQFISLCFTLNETKGAKRKSINTKDKENLRHNTEVECENSGKDGPKVFSDEFAVDCIVKLLGFSRSNDKGVRFRVCQLVGVLLKSISSDCDAFEKDGVDVWDLIEERMLERLDDKVPIVRVNAVEALERLQNPELEGDETCPVLEGYTRLLCGDSSAEVRKCVLRCICMSKDTLEHVIDRIRDDKEDVRTVAFTQLGSRVHMQALSISQRIFLLKHGLKDRSQKVRKECIRMLCEHWLKSKNGNPIDVLEALQVEAYEDTCELAIETIFKHVNELGRQCPEYMTRAISTNWRFFEDETDRERMLTAEGSLFWRIQCQMFKSRNEDEKVDEMIPDVVSFCDLLEQLLQTLYTQQSDADDESDEGAQEVHIFVIRQLLLIAKLLDSKHDLVGEQRLRVMVTSMLQEPAFSEDLIDEAVQVLLSISANETDFARHSINLISDINIPVESTVTTEESKLLEEFRAMRCLSITASLLKRVKKSAQIPEIEGLLDDIILPNVQSEYPLLRLVAVECLGLYCILNVDRARTHLPLFLTLFELEEEEMQIRLLALKATFDLIMAFGAQRLAHSEGDDELMFVLLQKLDSEEHQMRLAAAEGLAKLSFVSRLLDERVLQCLLVMLFHPSSESDVRLRQCLAVFFPAFSQRTEINKASLISMLPSVVATLMRPPMDSPLKELNTIQTLQYLFDLVSDTNAENRYQTYISVLCEVFADPSNTNLRGIVKILNVISMAEFTQEQYKKLYTLLCREPDGHDSAVRRILHKIKDDVESQLNPNEPQGSDDISDEMREELKQIFEIIEKRKQEVDMLIQEEEEERKKKLRGKGKKKKKRTTRHSYSGSSGSEDVKYCEDSSSEFDDDSDFV